MFVTGAAMDTPTSANVLRVLPSPALALTPHGPSEQPFNTGPALTLFMDHPGLTYDPFATK